MRNERKFLMNIEGMEKEDAIAAIISYLDRLELPEQQSLANPYYTQPRRTFE